MSVKISDLSETTQLHDECVIPVVKDGETKKLKYSSLKTALEKDLKVSGDVTVDSDLSDTSTNPVQNKVVTAKVNTLTKTTNDTLVEAKKAVQATQEIDERVTNLSTKVDAKLNIVPISENPISEAGEHGTYSAKDITMNFAKSSSLSYLDSKKQDKLTAGENITIENNVISATGGSTYDDSLVKGYEVQKEIDLGTIEQGNFGGLNENISSAQIVRTGLLDVRINGAVNVSGLPENVKYQIFYGDYEKYSTLIQIRPTSTSYIADPSFFVCAKYIRVKFVKYDTDGTTRLNIVPDDVKDVKFTYKGFEGTPVNKLKDKTVRVAAVTANEIEKAYADYVCDGVADEIEINQALQDLADMGGGTLKLSSGNFLLDNFNLDSDGVYRLISVPAYDGLTISIIGEGGMQDGNGLGTRVMLSVTAYNALDNSSTDKYELFGQIYTKTLPSTVLYMKKIRFAMPNNQKKVIFLDLQNFGRVTLEQLYGYAFINRNSANLSPAVEGLVGCRMLNGSNFGTENTYLSCGMNGFYEGWQVGSEHCYMRQCSAIGNVYGFTFGNYPFSMTFMHTITMVRCTDERNLNLPLFKACGWPEGKITSGQTINIIDLTLERKTDGTPGRKIYDLAKEPVDGTFNGTITFRAAMNDITTPFFEEGSGSNFTVINQLHKTYGPTSLRNSYGANQGQKFFDTDEKALYQYIEGSWIKIANAN